MVSIKASKAQVWSVLADYDHLAEILPNLHTSVPMKLAPGAPERYKRLRQVGGLTISIYAMAFKVETFPLILRSRFL